MEATDTPFVLHSSSIMCDSFEKGVIIKNVLLTNLQVIASLRQLPFGAGTQGAGTRFGIPPIDITSLSAGCGWFSVLTSVLTPFYASRFGFR